MACAYWIPKMLARLLVSCGLLAACSNAVAEPVRIEPILTVQDLQPIHQTYSYVTVCADPKLPEKTIEALLEAVERWTQALGGFPIYPYAVTPEESIVTCDVTVREVARSEIDLILDTEAAQASYGLPGIISLIRGQYEDTNVRYVLTHELGHVFGATHQQAGIMGSKWTLTTMEPECPDLLSVRSVLEANQLQVTNPQPCDL